MRPDPTARVSAPGIGLIVTGGLNVVATLVSMGFLAIAGISAIADTDQRDALPGVGVWAGVCVLSLVLSALMVYAGLQMRKVQSWGVCLAGSIAAMLPCTGCCFVGLPIGIWALLVLVNNEVKQAFESGPPPDGYGSGAGGFEPPPGGYGPPPSGYGGTPLEPPR